MTQLELALTFEEKDLLAECETIIERGLGVFIETGEALMAVRDNRLYRADFGTFEDYCQRRWALDRAHAYRLIDSARVVELISSPIGDEINDEPWDDDPIVPATESQARELAPLLDDPEELREVWAEAVERTEGRPTAAAIKAVREERIGEKAADPIWSTEEYALLEQVRAGRTVVVSMRGQHANLIAWAEREGRHVRIDRRTEWGNPFEMPADGDRATVIASYRDHYLPHKPGLLSRLDSLRGAVLGCWCSPEACHGDVLKARAEE